MNPEPIHWLLWLLAIPVTFGIGIVVAYAATVFLTVVGIILGSIFGDDDD